MKRRLIVLLALLGFFLLHGAEQRISVTEKSGISNTAASLEEALARATPGSTILIDGGTHRGPFVIDKDNLTLRGKNGAVITASQEWTPQWRPEPEYGFAFSSPIPFEPKVMHCDGRFMINVTRKRAGNGLKKIHRDGVGRSGRNVLRGVFTYLPEEKRVLVSFHEKTDIGRLNIEASCPAPAITLSGKNTTLENLIVFGGDANVCFRDATHCTVRKCLLIGGNDNVLFSKNANYCKVENCDITLNPAGMTLNAMAGSSKPAWDVWVAHKHFGTYDKTGVMFIGSGTGNEVCGNYLYNVWNGVTSGADAGPEEIVSYYQEYVFPQKAVYNIGQKVHHNRIDLCMDDALEPGGDLHEAQWYSNMVTRAMCGTRIKGVGVGPFFYFDNVMRYCNDGVRFYKTTAPQSLAFVYHNYIEHPYAICYHSINQVAWNSRELEKLLPVKGSPGYHAFNNVFVASEMLKPLPEGFIPNHKGDGNFYTCPRPAILPEKIDPNSRFSGKFEPVDAAGGDFRCKPGTEFAGVDLSKYQLPFADLGGRTPTAGLLGIEPEKTPHGPVSGLWDSAARRFNLGEIPANEFSLTSHRYLVAEKLEYKLKFEQPAPEKVTVKFMRGPEGRESSSYAVKITDDSGRLLAEKQESGSNAVLEFGLTVPARGGVNITVTEPERAARWMVRPEDGTPGVKLIYLLRGNPDPNAPGVRMIKYDSGPYIWEYAADAASPRRIFLRTASGYSGDFQSVVVRPDGVELPLSSSGYINIAMPGVWQIRTMFTKKAWLYGPPSGCTELILPENQPSGSFDLWPRPVY